MKGMELAQALTKLQVLTKRREGTDEELLIAAYMEKLSQYPANIVNWVLNDWADQNTFFPSWHELRDGLEFWDEDRRANYNKILNKLKNAA